MDGKWRCKYYPFFGRLNPFNCYGKPAPIECCRIFVWSLKYIMPSAVYLLPLLFQKCAEKPLITPHVAWVHFFENMATNAWMAYKGKSIIYETCFSWVGRGGGWACLLEEWAILGCHGKLQCATPCLTSLLFPTDLGSWSTQVSDQPLFGLTQFWLRVPRDGITVDISFIGKRQKIFPLACILLALV